MWLELPMPAGSEDRIVEQMISGALLHIYRCDRSRLNIHAQNENTAAGLMPAACFPRVIGPILSWYVSSDELTLVELDCPRRVTVCCADEE
jgi:hypothetical protein